MRPIGKPTQQPSGGTQSGRPSPQQPSHPSPSQPTRPETHPSQPTHPHPSQPTQPSQQPQRPAENQQTERPAPQPVVTQRPTSKPSSKPGYPYPGLPQPTDNGKPVYPPRPEQPPNQPTYVPPENAIGVLPPNSAKPQPGTDPNLQLAISKWPFYILPYPFPINGNGVPGDCGCNSQNNQVGSGSSSSTSSHQSSSQSQQSNQLTTQQIHHSHGSQSGSNQQQLSQPPYGVIGFIPVVFFPCLNDTQQQQIKQQVQPVALPYPCSQCQNCGPCQQQQPQIKADDVQRLFQYANSDPSRNFVRRRVRQRKAKIDENLQTPVELETESVVVA